eukprot:710651-Pelagomonas_calceolata.AAC.2
MCGHAQQLLRILQGWRHILAAEVDVCASAATAWPLAKPVLAANACVWIHAAIALTLARPMPHPCSKYGYVGVSSGCRCATNYCSTLARPIHIFLQRMRICGCAQQWWAGAAIKTLQRTAKWQE